jgi:AcrR family transcriptional regulator
MRAAMAGRVIAFNEGKRSTATKPRILDAAEVLFMEHGFEATSLRAITAAAGVNLAAALPCDRILQAMFVPALKLARDPKRGGKNFLRLLGRAYADPAPFIRKFLAAQYAEMIARFKAAFARALPDLPKKELSWRLHFIMGALSYTLAGTDALRLIAELAPSETANDELLLNRLAPFLLAGLQSPVPDRAEVARAAEHGTR